MPKFRLKGGGHRQRGTDPKGSDSKDYKKGDIFEDDKDLVALFGPLKFERMPDDTPLSSGQPVHQLSDEPVVELAPDEAGAKTATAVVEEEYEAPQEEEDVIVEKEEPPAATTEESEDGENITSRFPLAAKHNLTVIKQGKEYHIMDEDGDEIHDEPLSSLKKVEKELKTYDEE